MGIFDVVREAARRKLKPTTQERKEDLRKAADERTTRIKSYQERTKEIRAETGLLKAQRQRERFMPPPSDFGFGGGFGGGFGPAPVTGAKKRKARNHPRRKTERRRTEYQRKQKGQDDLVFGGGHF